MKKMLRIFVTAMTLFSASIFSIESAQAGLYAFTSHTFTPCGATGQDGPTTLNCTSSYSAAAWTANSAYFTTSGGIQLWTVPSTATYRITAYGARGGFGNVNSNAGGAGAKSIGDLALTQGQQIKILVGQVGSNSSNDSGAGGGGGSFVASSSNVALIVAGGGGGGAGSGSSGIKTGAGGAATNNGTASQDGTVAGGSGGSGGATPSQAWSGASGGGLTGNGGNGNSSSSPIADSGGKSFTNGGKGGNRGTLYSHGAPGGFGGGGGATWGAGGGGGYSGGGGDHSTGANNTDREGGGGGGSYVTGNNASMLASQNSGDGYVTIQVLVGPPDAPTIGTATMLSPTSASITFSAPSNNNGDTITAYTAISTPDSRTATLTQSGSGTITITGLSPDTTYVFRVYATNNYGNSSYSSPSASITTTRSPTSITISLAGNAQVASYRTPVTVTATVVGTEGRVTFFLNSKRLGNCLNKLTTSLVATCSWKPSIHGSANLSATFTPTSSAYLPSSTSRIYGVVARTNLR